jgi:hypothetical protein
VDHQPTRPEGPRPKPVALPRAKGSEPPETSEMGDLMELQRTAGNRAVADKLTSVQRHHPSPEEIS